MQISRILIPVSSALILLSVAIIGLSLLLSTEDVTNNNFQPTEPVPVEYGPDSLRGRFLAEKEKVKAAIIESCGETTVVNGNTECNPSHDVFNYRLVNPELIDLLENGSALEKSEALGKIEGMNPYALFPFLIEVIPERVFFRKENSSEITGPSVGKSAALRLFLFLDEIDISIYSYTPEGKNGSLYFLRGDEDDIHQAWMELWLKLKEEYSDFRIT